MALGLGLQAAGYAGVAAIATTHVSYLELGMAFTVAGVGTSFCFPTVANAVMGSVGLEQAGIASGTNSALRELGGIFGVGVLAATYAHDGSYRSPARFITGFTPAIWVAVALSVCGLVAALATPRRQPTARAEVVVPPHGALAGQLP